MFGHLPYYYETIDRHVIAFGSLFDEVRIERTNSNGTLGQVIRVPLTYAPKNKLLLRTDVDNDATKTAAVELPHMAFQLLPSFAYDGSRRLTHLEKHNTLNKTNPNHLKTHYVPVPYNLQMELYVYVNKITDGNKIIEQILPFFTPDWTVNIEFIRDTNLTFDVPIILESVEMDDSHWDNNFTERRVLIWTLRFLIKTYFIGPIRSKPIIKFQHERLMLEDSDVPAGEIITTPGMDANGNPTSNSAITVDPNIIYANNNYGYVVRYNSNN